MAKWACLFSGFFLVGFNGKPTGNRHPSVKKARKSRSRSVDSCGGSLKFNESRGPKYGSFFCECWGRETVAMGVGVDCSHVLQPHSSYSDYMTRYDPGQPLFSWGGKPILVAKFSACVSHHLRAASDVGQAIFQAWKGTTMKTPLQMLHSLRLTCFDALQNICLIFLWC